MVVEVHVVDPFAGIRHFRRNENWGDPDKMSPVLLQALDRYRERVGTPILVTRGTQGRGVDGSQHPFGRAVDLMFPSADPKLLLDLAFEAMRHDAFTGLGVYPDWTLNGRVLGGIHLDVRPAAFRAQWIGFKNPQGKTVYGPLTALNLKRYFPRCFE